MTSHAAVLPPRPRRRRQSATPPPAFTAAARRLPVSVSASRLLSPQTKACERSVSGRFAAQRSRLFCDTRSPLCGLPLHAPLTRSGVIWNVHSPIRSRSPDFLPALLRFPLRSHAVPQTTAVSARQTPLAAESQTRAWVGTVHGLERVISSCAKCRLRRFRSFLYFQCN